MGNSGAALTGGHRETLKRARAQGKARAKHEAYGKHSAKHSQRPKRHRRRRHRKHVTVKHVSGLPGAPSPSPIAVNPPAPSPSPPPALGATITLAQARRLLWRAAFGPTPGQAESLAGQPIEGVVQSLTRPVGAAVLRGFAPTDDE